MAYAPEGVPMHSLPPQQFDASGNPMPSYAAAPPPAYGEPHNPYAYAGAGGALPPAAPVPPPVHAPQPSVSAVGRRSFLQTSVSPTGQHVQTPMYVDVAADGTAVTQPKPLTADMMTPDVVNQLGVQQQQQQMQLQQPPPQHLPVPPPPQQQQQQQQMVAGPNVIVAGAVELPYAGPIAFPYRDAALGIVHRQQLDDAWRCYQGNPLCMPCLMATGYFRAGCAALLLSNICDCLCWESKLKPRSYAVVYENRIETNYPNTWCCGCCVSDNISVVHFDLLGDSVEPATCCTPFHMCWCVECFGGVVAVAPCACLNCCCCPCRSYIPGLSDARGFANAVATARAAVLNGRRMVRA